MYIKTGSKFSLRRGPYRPLVVAVVDAIVAEVDEYDRLGVRITTTIDDPTDESSRPNEQVTVSIFRFKLWVEWGKE